MNIRHNALLLSLVATASLVMSLPAYADRGKHHGHHSERHGSRHAGGHGGGHHNRGHHNGHHKKHYRGGHGHHERHWSPPRHVYHHAPPRYAYFAHGVHGYHDDCSHGHDYAYSPGYGSGLSLWLDGISFSYYERGW